MQPALSVDWTLSLSIWEEESNLAKAGREYYLYGRSTKYPSGGGREKDKQSREGGNQGHHGYVPGDSYMLPVTTRELLYLNTMHYIVRVMSYIFPAK